jgi:hypothetical protein
MKYYYYHAESDSLWSSNLDLEQEGNPDGCTEPINEEKAIEIMKRLKLKEIHHYNHKQLKQT